MGRTVMKTTMVSFIKGFTTFFTNLIERRSLILDMAKRDIASQHVGSLLGFFWTFVNPLIWIFIIWVVFSIGFKASPRGDVPFVIWLTAGMSIWSTFTDILNGSTGTIVGNSYLVRKMHFPLSILPIVKLVSSFITHFVFIFLLILMILIYNRPFSFFWFQAFYYFFAMSVLALGLSWITSSINVFIRDIGQIVNIVLQIGFWATPIFWDLDVMPPKIQLILKLNPMYYIVQGYRESFIYYVPVWHHWQRSLYYWGFAIFVFILGAMIFRSLRPHFADVL